MTEMRYNNWLFNLHTRLNQRVDLYTRSIRSKPNEFIFVQDDLITRIPYNIYHKNTDPLIFSYVEKPPYVFAKYLD